MDEPEHLSYEQQDADGYLQPKKYRAKCRCRHCGLVYYGRPTKNPDPKTPPCPARTCRLEREVQAKLDEHDRIEQMLDERRAPGHIGDKVGVRVIDETAKIVMEDYKLTNLRDNIREGEIAAPPLPTHSRALGGVNMQAAAESFFNGAEVARQQGGRRAQMMANRLRTMALSGGGIALRNQAVDIKKIQAAQGAQKGDQALVANRDGEGIVKLRPRG